MKKAISIIHSLSVMNIEQIEEAKIIIGQEGAFSEVQKIRFTSLCDWAIKIKRRYRSGKREV